MAALQEAFLWEPGGPGPNLQAPDSFLPKYWSTLIKQGLRDI